MLDVINIFLWCSLASYCFSFVPQITTNFRHKSTDGLSDLFLLLYTLGYGSFLYYVFCLDLPLPYKVMVPVEALLNVVLVVQRLYYHGVDKHPKNNLFSGALVACLLILLACFPWASQETRVAGEFFGWAATLIFALNQMPQIVKLYRAKSTEGFSFGFVSFVALGMFLELIGGLAKKLPLPTIVMAVRGLCVYLIFCVQFLRYKKVLKH